MLKQHSDWVEKVAKDALYDDYINEMKDQGRNFRLGRVGFGRFLQRAFPAGTLRSKQENVEVPWTNNHGHEILIKKRMYVYYLPELSAVRAWWDVNFGGPFVWPALEGTQPDLPPEDDKPPF
jgi:hypothetical protein